MEALFASGRAADIVLLTLLIEAAWLVARGWRIVDVFVMLAPAALIVLGLRAALIGSAWPWIAAPVALSFPVHLADLARRRRQR